MSADQKHNRLITSREKLSLVETNLKVFPGHILTQDEFSFHNFERETINTVETVLLIRSKEGESSFICRDGGNINFNTKYIVFVNYIQKFHTINSENYANFLRKLRNTMKNKHLEKLKNGVWFHHSTSPEHVLGFNGFCA